MPLLDDFSLANLKSILLPRNAAEESMDKLTEVLNQDLSPKNIQRQLGHLGSPVDIGDTLRVAGHRLGKDRTFIEGIIPTYRKGDNVAKQLFLQSAGHYDDYMKDVAKRNKLLKGLALASLLGAGAYAAFKPEEQAPLELNSFQRKVSSLRGMAAIAYLCVD